MVGRFERGRDVFAQQAWAETYRSLARTDRDLLDSADLERLAVAAYLLGHDDESTATWEDAHRRHLDAGDRAEAARCGFWVGFTSMMRGQMAHGGGWLSRTASLVGTDLECPAAGYLLIPALLHALDDGDPAEARDLAARAGDIAARFDDPDLGAFSTLGHGQSLLALGDVEAGTAKFDEVMLAISTGEVGPVATGIVYCAVILECMQIFDLARATEWTGALDDWCAAEPELVPFRGQCLVHRSQLLQASGNWSAAAATVESARNRLTDPPHPALGVACYQEAELHRLVGDFDAAATAYGRASRSGYPPMPGMALLELAQGDADAAAASIRRVLSETGDTLKRPPLLAAAVAIFRETRDLAAARAAADELTRIAEGSTSQLLEAMAAHAAGTVLLAEGDPAGALGPLRLATATWQQLRMPYEGARTDVLLGLSCAALGDRTSAKLEFENAAAAFDGLGAQIDRARVMSLVHGLRGAGSGSAGDDDAALSDREREVLAHVAVGETNREIAAALVISQHTVSRHLENIFAKLGVNTRAAATAHAYEHHLLDRER